MTYQELKVDRDGWRSVEYTDINLDLKLKDRKEFSSSGDAIELQSK